MASLLGLLGRRTTTLTKEAAKSGGRVAVPRRSGSTTQGYHTQYHRLPLSRGKTRANPLKVAYRDFSSYNKLKSLRFEDMMIKLKAIPKNAWDALGTRVQVIIIGSIANCFVLGVTSHGTNMCLKSIAEKQEKLEESQARTKNESEKAFAEIKAEVETILKSQEESAACQEKLQRELGDLKFFKDLWIAATYQEQTEEGSRTEVDGSNQVKES